MSDIMNSSLFWARAYDKMKRERDDARAQADDWGADASRYQGEVSRLRSNIARAQEQLRQAIASANGIDTWVTAQMLSALNILDDGEIKR